MTFFKNEYVKFFVILKSNLKIQGVVMTLRNSGTEPKLKYYLEYCGKPEQSNWSAIEDELKEMVKAMSVEFLEI